jgi:hypothetical protein
MPFTGFGWVRDIPWLNARYSLVECEIFLVWMRDIPWLNARYSLVECEIFLGWMRDISINLRVLLCRLLLLLLIVNGIFSSLDRLTSVVKCCLQVGNWRYDKNANLWGYNKDRNCFKTLSSVACFSMSLHAQMLEVRHSDILSWECTCVRKASWY